MYRRTFLCGAAAFAAHAAERSGLKLISTFPQKWGLFDISADGSCFLLERFIGYDSADPPSKQRSSTHEIQVKRTANQRRVRSLKMTFEGDFSRWVVTFVPGTTNVLLRGRRIDKRAEPGLFVWDMETDECRSIVVPARFELVACISSTAALGTLPAGKRSSKWVVLDLVSGAVADMPLDAPWSANDVELLNGWLRSPGSRKEIARQVAGIPGKHVRNGLVTRHGELVLVSGEVPGEVDPRKDKVFLSVHSLSTRALLRSRRLFEDEVVKIEKALLANVTYPDTSLNHVAFDVAVDRQGQRVALSWERWKVRSQLTPGLRYREPRFDVYRLDTLERIGRADHPSAGIWNEGMAGISPLSGGRLLFSPDGKRLFTTTGTTREWQLP